MPSICTVQQPQTPCSQPTWVPVAPSEWRRKSDSSMRGSVSADILRPFSVMPMRTFWSLFTRRIASASSITTGARLRRMSRRSSAEACRSS